MILDGKSLRDKLLIEYKEYINKHNLNIKLAIILIGDNEASKIYIKNKIKYCNQVGIQVDLHVLDEDVQEDYVIKLINRLNKDNSITGIILQSPIPNNLDYDLLSNKIDSKKDVDGFTKENIYKLYLNKKCILPCTVKGIIKLLEYYNIDLKENIVIIGRGNIVGKPLALALENKNATVTLCHSKTVNLKEITKSADILISAVGVPHLIDKSYVKKDSILVDVGISKVNNKQLGDIDYDELKDYVKYITPNPGGVGPMTVAMIINNLIEMKEEENG